MVSKPLSEYEKKKSQQTWTLAPNKSLMTFFCPQRYFLEMDLEVYMTFQQADFQWAEETLTVLVLFFLLI